MDSIRKREVQPMAHRMSDFYDDDQSQESGLPTLLAGIARRWRIVLTTFLIVCTIGLPAVWIVMKPYYQATAAIRVTPVVSSILFSGDNSIPMYKNFVRTQADLMVSDVVLQSVGEELVAQGIMEADEAKGGGTVSAANQKNLSGGCVMALKNMVSSGTLRVQAEDNTELIKITMKSSSPDEAAAVANTFLNSYMTIVARQESQGEDDRIAVLENEATVLNEKLQRQRRAINELIKEYGTASLTARQEMKLGQISALQSKITEFEMQRISLQIKEQLLTNQGDAELAPHERVRLRYDFVNADLMVKTLTVNAAQLEQELMIARQQLAGTNPQLARKAELVEALQERLQQRCTEVGANFDGMVQKELARNDVDQLADIAIQLEQISTYQQRLQEMLSAEDINVIELGRKQLAIDDLQSQYEVTKELHATVNRRIQEIGVERNRPAKISRAYFANTAPLQDKRQKYTLALLFGGLGLGAMLGILRNRFDLSVHTPGDVARTTGIRILGTTTRSRNIEDAFLPEHFVNDYQTICANIGLLDGAGIPRIITVTSPRPRDGKTTLAINLSVSLAKMGKKVLLVDGDLRKADIAFLLKLCGTSNGLKHVLLGENPEEFICHTSVEGLDLLPSNPCEPSMIYNLLSPERVENALEHVSLQYDHIIIDTPPALDVPDALLWARAVDAVILTAYSGHTKSIDIREAIARLERAQVPVLGAVLSNVAARQSYNAFHWYAESTSTLKPNLKGTKRAHLLPMGEEDENGCQPENAAKEAYAIDCDA